MFGLNAAVKRGRLPLPLEASVTTDSLPNAIRATLAARLRVRRLKYHSLSIAQRNERKFRFDIVLNQLFDHR